MLCRCCTGAVAVMMVVVLVDPLSQMMCSLPNEALRNNVASRTRRNVRQLRGSMRGSMLASLLLLMLLGATAMCINEVICTFFELLLTTNGKN